MNLWVLRSWVLMDLMFQFSKYLWACCNHHPDCNSALVGMMVKTPTLVSGKLELQAHTLPSPARRCQGTAIDCVLHGVKLSLLPCNNDMVLQGIWGPSFGPRPSRGLFG